AGGGDRDIGEGEVDEIRGCAQAGEDGAGEVAVALALPGRHGEDADRPPAPALRPGGGRLHDSAPAAAEDDRSGCCRQLAEAVGEVPGGAVDAPTAHDAEDGAVAVHGDRAYGRFAFSSRSDSRRRAARGCRAAT